MSQSEPLSKELDIRTESVPSDSGEPGLWGAAPWSDLVLKAKGIRK